MGTSRKPAGFWTEDDKVKALMEKFVRGKATLDETTDALSEYCAELDVNQPREAIKADVVWYARGVRKALGLPGIKEAARSGSVRPVERVAIGEGGRVVIPASYRQALNLHEGDEIIMQLAGGELRLLTPQEALRRAQELVSRYVPAGRSLADELIEERRQEARRDRSGS